MGVHVSIHDVSPAWETEVDVALAFAHAHGVRPALLVVPDFHGRAPLDESPRYCERLRALQAEGHEIYLHGYYHRARVWDDPTRPASAATGPLARVRHAFAQRVVSGGEAEFSDVSRDEAEARLDRGERVLRDAGLDIRGFVAPAWSMPPWMHDVLAARGYAFSEDHVRVYDPSRKSTRSSLVLNFASRTPGRLLSSVAYCRAARPVGRWLPSRIAIHPADMRYALLRHEVDSLLAWGEGHFVERGSDLLQ